MNAATLRRAVLAMVDNALAHTPPGGTVTVRTSAGATTALISVSDNGPGITGVDQDRIFDRFVRTYSSTPHQGRRSFGIGLALVREIAANAGGTVRIASTGDQGTDMQIVLPLARRSPAGLQPRNQHRGTPHERTDRRHPWC